MIVLRSAERLSHVLFGHCQFCRLGRYRGYWRGDTAPRPRTARTAVRGGAPAICGSPVLRGSRLAGAGRDDRQDRARPCRLSLRALCARGSALADAGGSVADGTEGLAAECYSRADRRWRVGVRVGCDRAGGLAAAHLHRLSIDLVSQPLDRQPLHLLPVHSGHLRRADAVDAPGRAVVWCAECHRFDHRADCQGLRLRLGLVLLRGAAQRHDLLAIPSRDHQHRDA